ncbi:MAG TPA: MFS transporter [Ktedonobacteraceae bacterium]|nr:MFS transporter [Ktedonobacteraceae bacterium]
MSNDVSVIQSVHSQTGAMKSFFLVWFGQLISVTGSGLTQFALGIWVYQLTGSATKLALTEVFAVLPAILISPLAGVLVDRHDRRWAMILSDAVSGISTLFIALLLAGGHVELWVVYLVAAIKSICTAFQWPAYSALVTVIVPRQHLVRASGMVQFSEALAQFIAPALAGVLIAFVKIWGVILVDVATFLFAVVMVGIASTPPFVPGASAAKSTSTWATHLLFGWKYIQARPALMALLVFFAVTNFLTGIVMILSTPLVLSFASVRVLGGVLSSAGLGMIFGSLTMSVWGGPKKLTQGILVPELVLGMTIIFAGLRPNSLLVASMVFLFSFCIPIIMSCSQAIWQRQVEPAVQGRVFAVRRMISWSSLPLAYAVVGPLADHVFIPLMRPGTPLYTALSPFLGSGSGRGIGLMFVGTGICALLVSVWAYFYSPMRQIEEKSAAGTA